jgi:catechol 2,3-dioxygenase-like lactoylglutathione lyase family enzyme
MNTNLWEIGQCAEIALCVRDAEAVADLYANVFEYECADRMTTYDRINAGLAAFWNLDETVRVKQIVMKYHAAQNACVRLVEFQCLPAKQSMMRSGHNIWDTGGVFGLDVRVQDTAAMYETLIAQGFHGINEPLQYTIDKFTVFEALLKGHDEIGYGIIQRLRPPLPEPPARQQNDDAMEASVPNVSSPPILVLCPVVDLEESVRFFTEMLGFHKLMESTFVQNTQPAPSVLGLPHNLSHNVKTAITLVAPSIPPNGEREGVIELVQMHGVEGRDFTERCTPPHLGVMAIRYPVCGIEAYYAEVQARGVRADAPLMEISWENSFSTYTMQAFAVRSPSGIRIEFIEEYKRSLP